MYCCTFYSYKGGVGRTLALANVAVEHGRAGRRVLVVDFDLEAPGLSTLSPFEQASGKPGVIDFVQKFLTDQSVPDAAAFIHKCIYEDDQCNFEIDVMPAGCGDEGYSQAFSSIDWGELYEERNGFLLMEDLRAQWARLGYDYVYIDSRTGLTDSGGICTRQLPDAVAVIFFPNMQNLLGLEQIVPEIRGSEGRPAPIETLFVASRVPRLDDEHNLLRNLLTKFEDGLKYESDDLVTLEQYDSLSLLDQQLFVLKRRTSGLAKQYIDLASRIAQLNIEDPDGMVAHLRSRLGRDGRAQESQLDVEAQRKEKNRLVKIGDHHDSDNLIQFLLARVFFARRDLLEAMIASDRSLLMDVNTKASEGLNSSFVARAHQFRLRIASELGFHEKVVESATFIVQCKDASDTAILDALINLAAVDPDKLPDARDLPALDDAEPRRLLSVAMRLTWNAPAMELAAALIEKMLIKSPTADIISEEDLTDVQLPLIATGRFSQAYSVFELVCGGKTDRLDIWFNSAMAKWGMDGSPDRVMLENVLLLFGGAESRASVEANRNECRALIEGVLGYIDEMMLSLTASKEAIAGHIEFSCWNFMNVSPDIFSQHLDSIKCYILENGPQPEFLRPALAP